MRNNICSIALVLGFNLICAGCDNRIQSATRTIPNPSTLLNASMSDSGLENAIHRQFKRDLQLNGANLKIKAVTERNEITVFGTVLTHAAREKAIALAKSVKPGALVKDEIDVASWPSDV
jgi:osmotically-inducible protein OsmY